MSDITLNSAVRSNLRSLQSTTALMNQTEGRLSSGKKVNSALDNPSNFFTAQALDRRSGDLSNLLDSVANSVQTLKAADNGISAISDLVNQMKSTARTAQQSTSAVASRASFSSNTVTGLTADNLLGTGAPTAATVTGTAVLTTASGTPVADGTTVVSGIDGLTLAEGDSLSVNGKTITFKSTADATSGNTIGLDLDTADVDAVLGAIETALGAGSSAAIGTDGKITAAAADGTTTFSFGGTAAGKLGLPTTTNAPVPNPVGPLSGETLTVQVGSLDSKTITFGTGDGQVNTLDELNAQLKSAGASASVDASTNKLTIKTSNAYEGDDITIGGSVVATDGSATIADGEAFAVADTDAATASAVFDDTDKKSRNNYQNDYNDLLTQITTLAKDASYNGINLLAGDDLKVTFNEDGSSSLDIGGTDVLDTLGLKTLSGDEFLDSSSLDGVVDSLNTALSNLDSLSSKFGSQLSVVQTRQDFTKNMIGTLDDGSNNLTAADTNEEAANLATLQTRQSLIVSSLSISTSQEQNILQLLR